MTPEEREILGKQIEDVCKKWEHLRNESLVLVQGADKALDEFISDPSLSNKEKYEITAKHATQALRDYGVQTFKLADAVEEASAKEILGEWTPVK